MKKLMAVLMVVMASSSAFAFENSLSFKAGNHAFTVPFKQLDVTQLYSFKEGKGFPALQTVVYDYKARAHVAFGAAPVIGSSNAVPFVSGQVLLSKGIFDPSVGPMWLGVWVGKQFKSAALDQPEKTMWGINASVALW
jgi:hypothetical protein